MTLAQSSGDPAPAPGQGSEPSVAVSLLCLLAGLLGAAGVALAAAATHAEGPALLGPASAMCLAHAPAMLALLALRHLSRTTLASALALGLGTTVFAGDLMLKQFHGVSLFPYAAPLGGLTMIAGWLLIALGALAALARRIGRRA